MIKESFIGNYLILLPLGAFVILSPLVFWLICNSTIQRDITCLSSDKKYSSKCYDTFCLEDSIYCGKMIRKPGQCKVGYYKDGKLKIIEIKDFFPAVQLDTVRYLHEDCKKKKNQRNINEDF